MELHLITTLLLRKALTGSIATKHVRFKNYLKQNTYENIFICPITSETEVLQSVTLKRKELWSYTS